MHFIKNRTKIRKTLSRASHVTVTSSRVITSMKTYAIFISTQYNYVIALQSRYKIVRIVYYLFTHNNLSNLINTTINVFV